MTKYLYYTNIPDFKFKSTAVDESESKSTFPNGLWLSKNEEYLYPLTYDMGNATNTIKINKIPEHCYEFILNFDNILVISTYNDFLNFYKTFLNPINSYAKTPNFSITQNINWIAVKSKYTGIFFDNYFENYKMLESNYSTNTVGFAPLIVFYMELKYSCVCIWDEKCIIDFRKL